MERRVITLTPDLAKGYLSSIHPKQRKLNSAYAATLARDIESGRWNNDYSIIDVPLAFSVTGQMLNGQHRCKAVVTANRPIQVSAVFGVEDNIFDYMDNAKGRTSAQFVDAKNATLITSLARVANSIEQGQPLNSAVSRPTVGYVKKQNIVAGRIELLNYISEHEDILEFCATQGDRIYRAFNRRGGGKAAYAIAVWILLYTRESNEAAISMLVDDIVSVPPMLKAVAQGKDKGIRKIMDAQAAKVSINNKYWIGLILAMYDRQTKPLTQDKAIDTAFKRYCDLVEARQNEQ